MVSSVAPTSLRERARNPRRTRAGWGRVQRRRGVLRGAGAWDTWRFLRWKFQLFHRATTLLHLVGSVRRRIVGPDRRLRKLCLSERRALSGGFLVRSQSMCGLPAPVRLHVSEYRRTAQRLLLVCPLGRVRERRGVPPRQHLLRRPGVPSGLLLAELLFRQPLRRAWVRFSRRFGL
jgi:hypothetical protein